MSVPTTDFNDEEDALFGAPGTPERTEYEKRVLAGLTPATDMRQLHDEIQRLADVFFRKWHVEPHLVVLGHLQYEPFVQYLSVAYGPPVNEKAGNGLWIEVPTEYGYIEMIVDIRTSERLQVF